MRTHILVTGRGIRRRRNLSAFALTMGLALLLGATVAESDEIRLRSAAPENRIHRPHSRDTTDRAASESVVWLQGVLRMDSQGRLSLEGTPINLSRATGIYPLPEGGFATAEDVANQRVSIAGAVTRAGLEARLILVQPIKSLVDQTRTSFEHPDIEPSESDPAVGVYRPDTPR